ncbi:MAG: alanine racemase [Limnochordia bacterium]|jgi:alanine racemase
MENLRVWAQVDLGAVAHNTRAIDRFLNGKCKIMAVVKDNAYGHGAVEIARTVLDNGAHSLGVSTVEEGCQLRAAGIKAPILVLGAILPGQVDDAVREGLAVALFDQALARDLNRAAQRWNQPALAHLKVDTGMGRLGVLPPQVPEFLQALGSLDHLDLQGIFTHLATADEEDETYTLSQLKAFEEVLATCRRYGYGELTIHAANTAATLAHPQSHYDLVRPGLGIYGLHPSPKTRSTVPLQPVLSLYCRVMQVKEVPSGSAISYGCTYRTQGPTKIAVLPIGYADGFLRILSNNGRVIIKGRSCPVVGRVCMDYCMVDVGDLDVEPGEPVQLIGPDLPVEEVAEKMGTISYEVLCLLGPRVRRCYV